MREIKFRAWDNGQMEYSEPMPDFGFWKWAAYSSSTILMQYTGLKDKNGKEIYEGDILTRSTDNRSSFVAVIEFKRGVFGGTTIPGNAHFISMPKLPHCDYDGTGYDEVIGNIYENPELISKPTPQ